jgi:3-isopropylmalate/(R)-2-methylmalate dehydratase small subunit
VSVPLVRLTAVAAPLLRDNINTDAIIPSREIKLVSRHGLADGLFADWRYTAVGGREPAPGFVLNDPRFAGAAVLVAGANFGCGSSREHAAWALAEYGFRAVVAENFNAIFRGNAVVNGIVPIVLSRGEVAAVAATIASGSPVVTVDLDTLTLTTAGQVHDFMLDDEARAMLREGLDTIDLTLRHAAAITAFHTRDRRDRPWVYPASASDQ